VTGFGLDLRGRLGSLLKLALSLVFFQGHGEHHLNTETPLGFARGRLRHGEKRSSALLNRYRGVTRNPAPFIRVRDLVCSKHEGDPREILRSA